MPLKYYSVYDKVTPMRCTIDICNIVPLHVLDTLYCLVYVFITHIRISALGVLLCNSTKLTVQPSCSTGYTKTPSKPAEHVRRRVIDIETYGKKVLLGGFHLDL